MIRVCIVEMLYVQGPPPVPEYVQAVATPADLTEDDIDNLVHIYLSTDVTAAYILAFSRSGTRWFVCHPAFYMHHGLDKHRMFFGYPSSTQCNSHGVMLIIRWTTTRTRTR